MNRYRLIQDGLFSLIILGILLFLNVPYLPIVLSGVFILIYSAVRNGLGEELGFIRPADLSTTIGTAILMSIFVVGCSLFLFRPALEFVTGETINLGPFAQVEGNTKVLLVSLLASWIVGGFMEEIIFRGFFLSRIMKAVPSKAGAFLGVAMTSALFGYLHDYQGITGQLLTGVLGAILGGIYVLNQGKI
ncbi:MAG: CPBP family intramembrane glutamic endopeptidase [Cyclobacteriaceae bacterium]